MSGQALLQVDRLGVEAGGRRVLEDICLEIGSGEIHALLGRNGAGKSTLARSLMGCGGTVGGGSIRFDGEDLAGFAVHEQARRGIALAWQEPARFEGLPVRAFLALGRARRAPAECLRRVGLEPESYLDRPLDAGLSGGERKRIELAGILALEPRLAILDEPAAGIDLLSLDEVRGVIAAMQKSGSAVLLITHREDMARLARRASQLCGGRIVCRGDPKEVIAHYREGRCIRCDGEICHD